MIFPIPFDLDAAQKTYWYDGQSEISSYATTNERYGELRTGTAVSIFVTETFSQAKRVKSDVGKNAAADEIPVMKHNFVNDFSTGIYDYNLMTSSFVSLQTKEKTLASVPSGHVAKVSFSSQEWCGHVYSQILPNFLKGKIKFDSHSYFDGEADEVSELSFSAFTLPLDAGFHWARGLASPKMKLGEVIEASVVPRLTDVRLAHFPIEIVKAKLSVSKALPPEKHLIYKIETAGQRTFEYFVEDKEVRKILGWKFYETNASGSKFGLNETGTFKASIKNQYWDLKRNSDKLKLKELKL